jgi:hypothetical protein
MIAQKFRPVMWVLGVALAATLLYIVSLQVATERSRLEAVDQKIAQTHREIRQLQTEMGTRSSMRQLERWNGEVLALSAPTAQQYLPGEEAIDRIGDQNLGDVSAAPPPVMVAAAEMQMVSGGQVVPKPVVTSAAIIPAPSAKPAPAASAVPVKVAQVTVSKPAKPVVTIKPGLSKQDRQVMQALTSGRPAKALAKPERVAMADKPATKGLLLSSDTLRDAKRQAAREAGSSQ